MSPVHAFFDFDDTLLRGDSILYWQRFYYKKRPKRQAFRVFGWLGLLLLGLRVIDSHTLKRIFLWPMAFEKPEALDALAEEFVRQDLARRFHGPVLQRLWTHHLLGHRIVVISASGIFYLKYLKALLPMADIQGTEIVFPRKGLLRFPRYTEGNLRGANKLVRLKAMGFGEHAPLSFAYSDHPHDAFLLRFSDFPICVRPTPELREMAAAEGWPVLDWPRDRPAWTEKLSKLVLLLLALGPEPKGMPVDPAREAAASRDYFPIHCGALRQRVGAKFSEDGDKEIYREIFGDAVGSMRWQG